MKLYDTHIHSSFSADSEASPEEQIKRAVSAGLSGITFTDHLDPDFPAGDYMFDRDEYFRQLLALKEKYKEQIEVRTGAEIGLRLDQEGILEALADEKPYDFVIGSIHVVDGYDPYYKEYWEDLGTYEGLRRFFEVSAECAERFDFFDSFGHIDYIYRYAPADERDLYPVSAFMPYIERILKALISKGKALEVNTGGWSKGLSFPHPCPEILRLYKKLGGRLITIGSDAHSPDLMGRDMNKACGYLFSCGFNEYAVYTGRHAFSINIEKKTYSAVVFDMDGTVLNTLDDLTASANHALKVCGFPARTRDEIRSFIGNGVRKLLTRALPADVAPEVYSAAYDAFSGYYLEHCSDMTCEYPGITELIKKLREKGLKTAVVSNKADPAVAELAEKYFHGLFDRTIGGKGGLPVKPSPDALLGVLKEMKIKAEDAVYIGDSDVDIATARNAGMDIISVSWGYKDEKFLRDLGSENIARTPEELEYFINL